MPICLFTDGVGLFVILPERQDIVRRKMKLRISFWSIFFHFLAVILCFHGSGAREMLREELMVVAPKIPMDDDLAEGVIVLKLHSMDEREEKDIGMGMEDNTNRLHGHGHDHKRGDETRKMEETGHVHGHGHGHSSSHMDHLDPSVIVFFTMKDLKLGKTLPIYFARKHLPPLLPKEQADSIPFSYSQLHNLLEFFSFPQGSPQAKSMENTLTECEIKPIKGETKLCATSQESMLDFVHKIFGVESYFRVTTSYLTKSSALLQNYTILEVPIEIPAPKMVACHTMPYPYAIYYCHSQLTENKVFKVSLEGQINGDRVDALAVCHLDTSAWSRDHISFRILEIEPGTSPVCHFFPADNLIWVPRPTLD